MGIVWRPEAQTPSLPLFPKRYAEADVVACHGSVQEGEVAALVDHELAREGKADA